MSGDHTTRIMELLSETLELDPADRSGFLDQACGDDAKLREEIESLLRAHEKSGSFLDTPVAPDEPTSARSLIGQRIGRYELRDIIAVGGMGVVYRAEQEQPQRQVAIKLLRPGLATQRILKRFEHEVEILGRLSHPGIARIIEAGTFDAGAGAQPFFAMEYIDGLPLMDYVRAHQFDVEARLHLMTRICDAVQHAHLKGIVHRDLKPSNILIEESGQPRVLDFGVARLTEADTARVTMHTETGQLLGTLTYMSPEQVAGLPDEIDARSDVFSLGAVMYELFVGHVPHEVDRQSIFEAARIIREQPPARMSALVPNLRSEIETIVLKALEKARERRYQSAGELGADIQRLLNNEPILARAPSTFYLLRTFARRNRPLVSGVVGVFLILVLGIIGISWQAKQAIAARDEAERQTASAIAERERAEEAENLAEKRLAEALDAREREAEQRRRAEEEADIARATSEFLIDLLGSIHPGIARGREVTVREVLDAAAPTIDERFVDHPRVRGALHQTVGGTYQPLGRPAEAEEHLRKAFKVLGGALDENDAQVLRARASLALVLGRLSQFDEAEQLLDEGIEISLAAFGQDDPVTLSLQRAKVYIVYKAGRGREAEELARQSIERHVAVFGDIHEFTIEQRVIMADLQAQRGMLEEAEHLLALVVGHAQEHLGYDHYLTMGATGNLALIYRRQSRLDEAEKLYLNMIMESERVLGPRHPETLRVKGNLGSLYRHQQRLEEAKILHETVLAARREALGNDHQDTLSSINNLAMVLYDAGRIEEALPLFRESLEVRRRILGTDHPMTLNALMNLGGILEKSGRVEEAELHLREAIEIGEMVFASDDFRLAPIHRSYAFTLRVLGRMEDVEHHLVRSLEILRQSAGPDHPRTRESEIILIEHWLDVGKTREAVALLEEAWDQHERSSQPDEQHRKRLLEFRERAETMLAGEPG